MAVLKCHECGYTKGLSDQYIGKSVKCPQCGHATKIYDTALLLTAYSKKVLEIQTELKEVKQVVASYQTYTAQPVYNPDEQTQSLNKLFRENRIAMTEFNDATKLRNNMMLRMEQAGIYLMRFSVIGFLIILVFLGFFMIQLNNKADDLTTQLATIGGGIQSSSQELSSIRTVVSSLNVEGADSQTMQADIEALNQEIERLNKRLKSLSEKYNSLYYPYR